MRYFIIVISVVLMNFASASKRVEDVEPAFETDPVLHSGDAADDIAIWVHPVIQSESVIFGSDKKGGIQAFDWKGKTKHYYGVGEFNNIDIRQRISVRSGTKDFLVGTNRSQNALDLFEIDSKGELIFVARQPSAVDAYGICSFIDEYGKYFVFITSKSGQIEQWQLVENEFEEFGFELARVLNVDSQAEGCVVDDEMSTLYIAEEDYGIWKVDSRPDHSGEMRLVDRVKKKRLKADIEGLALYRQMDGRGYLIASSQGSSSFTVYERQGDNDYVGSFSIRESKSIDKVTGTDGIEVLNYDFGGEFSEGVFIAQDDENEDNQNFKVVSWERIAEALKLD